MAEKLPGFIPRVLQLGDVSLLRADEAVLKAMVDGHRSSWDADRACAAAR
jgi:integrase/recombinase XerD